MTWAHAFLSFVGGIFRDIIYRNGIYPCVTVGTPNGVQGDFGVGMLFCL